MYIRQSRLRNLKEYKYSAVDHSLVSRYLLKPFYTNVFIHVFPMWMAPNLITLSGLLFVITNTATLLWYNPTLDRDCPGWVYASWSIGLFLYQTFDACDGTQARRTKQSGPLGELFDHGVDAINTTLELLLFAGAINLGQSWATLLTMFAATCAFYLTTWEEYHTGTLYLGLVSGPVEGILTVCLVYAITAFKGGSFWQRPMLETLGLPAPGFLPDVLREMPFNHWYLVYGGLILAFNIFQSSQNVVRARRSKDLSIIPALAGLAPFFLSWLLMTVYLSFHPQVLHHYLVPCIFFFGTSFAYQVGLIITAHLTKSPFPYLNILLLPMAIGALDSVGPWIQKHPDAIGGIINGWPSFLGGHAGEGKEFVFTCLGLAVGIYGSFIFDVVANICEYLDIWCLSIKYRYDLEKREEGKSVKAH